MLGKDYAGQDCALAATLEVLGERWTLLIVRDAFFGVRRYSDWVARLDIPRAVLSERLRGLVANEVLVRRDDPARPGRAIYELTPAGEELWPAVHALVAWGARHRHPSTNEYRHAVCGTELGPGAACPACGGVPAAHDVLLVPRAPARAGRTDPVSAAMRTPRRMLEPLEIDPVRARRTGDAPTEHAGA